MKKRVIPFILALICTIMALTPPVKVLADPSDPSSDGSKYSLELKLKADNPAKPSEEIPIEGVHYYLYRVADILYLPDDSSETTIYDGNYYLKPVEDFKEVFTPSLWKPNDNSSPDQEAYPWQLNFWETEADSLSAMIAALSGYIEENSIPDQGAGSVSDNDEDNAGSIPCLAEAYTDSEGKALFEKLPAGLYLALGDPLEIVLNSRQYICTPQSTLVAIPYQLSAIKLRENMEIDVKADILLLPEEEVEFSVRKVWEGSGDHPGSVTVELLADGRVYDAVTLSGDNNWSYTWRAGSLIAWTVRENPVPDGWQAVVTRTGNSFTITNRYTTTSPDVPGTAPPNVPDTVSPDGSTPDSPGLRSLPQTAQLWWPVPILIAVGLPVYLTGAALFLGKEEFEEPYE